MNKMHYLLFTAAGFPEGNASSVYLNNLLKGLIYNRRTVDVFLLNSNKNTQGSTSYGVTYTYLSKHISDIWFINRILSIFIISYNIFSLLIKTKRVNEKLSVLISNNRLEYNIIIHIASFFLNIPTVSFVSEYFERPSIKTGIFKVITWYGFYLNLHLLNRFSSKLIVFSTFLKDFYLKKGYKEKKIFVQPNLTDFDYWKSANHEIKFDIGYSGTAEAKDGLIHIFDAVRELKNKNIIVTVLIVGDLTYGESVLPGLKQYCKSLGILDQLTFTGLIPHKEVKNYLSQCECLVLPRVYTRRTQAGFPTKMGEYFACNKIIIASNFGNMERYFIDKTDLILVDELNASNFADSIVWYKNNPTEVSKIRTNGYLKAHEIFDYKINVDKIIDFVET